MIIIYCPSYCSSSDQ